MNCNEVKTLLMPFHDGELDPAVAAEVETALSGCPECQVELELSRLHTFAADAFTATVPEVDLSGVYDGVMARIAAEDAAEATSNAIEGVRVQREDAAPGLIDRIGTWFSELFRLQRPVTAFVAAAAVAALVAGVWFSGSQSTSPGERVDGGDPGIAKIDNNGKRRGREGEVSVTSSRVEAIADKGEVKVITFDDSDDEPIVLWHVVEGEGVSMPNGSSNGTKGL